MPDAYDRRSRQAAPFLWAMVAIYAVARVLQLFTGRMPLLVVLGMHVLPALAFALVHGALRYRVRNSIAFVLLFLIVGNVIENLGVATGFPFGHYYFTDGMGPKLFQVPIFLGLAYVGLGYISWVLAEILVKDANSRRANVLRVAAVAAVIMTSWDLSQDPVWSTVLHLWTWTTGGAYFGVPSSNFLGWLLTTFLIYLCFALLLNADGRMRERSEKENLRSSMGSSHMWAAVAFYALAAAGNVLLLISRPPVAVVADPTGTQWRVRDITFAGALVSIFLMGAFVCWASLKLKRRSRGAVVNSSIPLEAS